MAILLALATLLSPLPAEELSILPLGDSITEGGAYRHALWKQMIDAGHEVEFMGAGNNGEHENYKGHAWDGDHQSVGGINSQALLGSLPAGLEETKAKHDGRLVDLVLYHIGTNDINTTDRAQGENYVDTVAIVNMERTIDVLRKHNPNVAIFVCKILPIVNSQTVRVSLVGYINKRIEDLAGRKTTKQSPVIVVDQNTGFDASNGVDSYDGMHPNGQGGEKMAAKFLEAIMAYRTTRTQTILVSKELVDVPENGRSTVQVKFSLPIADGRSLTVNTSAAGGDRDIRVAQGATLTFDSGNWNKYQSIVLEAANDEDDVSGTASLDCSSSAPIATRTIEAAEVDDDYTGPVPIVWWKFDDATEVVRDSSGNGLHGQGYGRLTRGEPGKSAKAFKFESNAFVAATPDKTDQKKDLVFAGEQMTLAAWIHPVSHGNNQWQGIFGASDWGAPCLSLKNEGWLLFGIVGAGDPVNGGQIALNEWTHVAVTFDDADDTENLRYFVNGIPVGPATTYSAKIGEGKAVRFIGKRAWEGQHYFNGLIDDVRIYGGILSEQEILEISNSAPRTRKAAASSEQEIMENSKSAPGTREAAASATLDGWPELQRLLFRSRGIYRELPKNVVTGGYCGGPLLGNGEIGAAIGGDATSQTIYLNRLDFWNRGLGGVTISAEGKGSTPDSFRYVQDIERAEVRSRVTIAGHPTTMNTWVAVDQPLMVSELTNTSSRAVTYRIQPWTKGPRSSVDTPYCFRRGGRPNMLRDLGDEISVKPEGSRESGQWVFEATKRDGEVYLKNVGTGRYLYAADKASAMVAAGPIDPGGMPGAVWAMPDTRLNFILKNILTGKVLDSGDDGLTLNEDNPENRNKLSWWTEMPERVFHPSYSGSDRDATWAQSEYTGGSYAACAAIVTRILGNQEVATDKASATVTIPGGESVLLVTSVDGDGNKRDQADKLSTCLQRGKDRVMGMTPGSIATLTGERVDWWHDFWMKSYVDLGDDVLNRFWYGAFYSLSCTSRGHNECPGLWGAWITLQFTKWGNAKTLNYNYQSPFYGVYSGNRPDLAEPYYTDVLYNLPWAQFLAARAGYKGGMLPRIVGPQGGIGFPAGPTPVAETKDRKRLPNDQLDSMAFVAMNFINHYTYTLDEEFLREKAWPVMLACADFYEDYLVFEDGRYVFKESAAREGGGDTNPCYPLAYVSFVFKSCLQVADLMEIPESRREKWRHIIKHMSAFPTAEVDGMTVLKEAESLSRITIRGPGDNSSLLQTVHPGEGINLGSAPELLKIGHDTVKYLNSEPAHYAWSQHNNFPMIFTQAARVGWDAEDLWRQFKARISAEMRPNLTVEQWGGGIESSGTTEAVHSMLMQGHEDVLRLFPVWPRNRDAKFARLRAKGAFVVSSMLKEGEVRYVRILSEHGTDCELVNPWPKQRVALYRDGKAAKTLKGGSFTLKTAGGETLLLGPEGISHKDLQARMLEVVRTDRTNLVNRFDTAKDLSRITFTGAYGSMRPWWIDVPGEERLDPNPGRQGIIGVHPESTKVPCIVSREVSIPAKGNPRLRIVASACPRKGVVDYVMQAGIDNGDSAEWFDAELVTAGPTPSEDGWKTFEYDLAKYANQDVMLLVKVACGGENPWNCDIGYFDEISVIVE